MAYTSTIWSKSQLAVAVRDARIARGLTQAELAQRVGVSRPWISRFESGHVENAGFERIMKLFEVLDMRMEVSYETNKSTTPSQGDDSASVDNAGSAVAMRRVDRAETSRFAVSGGLPLPSAGVESLMKVPGIDNVQWGEMRKRMNQWAQAQFTDGTLGASMARLAESLKLAVAQHDEVLSEAVKQTAQATISAVAKDSESQRETNDDQSCSR
ncbi:XRE family transcriptional regulator [Bifidobacterium pseudolongum subsp. globosum]|uniref:helix-turn-helix transcriptional regulator n=1 Tax=Bifidobacterium pseudolongum TaxID=1694 RepID=UPI0010218CCC|nr:helix-turn-helix domain-containing protein [Bifidobacterium pseudolongum]RYQ05920.1 XRE family transcriptional regulator [Bifidobacterium pseudolongum subsp. globosum]RYQ10798.1 XRE family transcriptional regulator [Bifidobacterium pseudolongum subsp. globosum]RYQ15131.1 XRE family transcriptional regulator [Bifidobacterium pseudolongum subsp. globosum]RYQ17139.1 XRE family transcriptional regulator [Bifidobacterium pseudolongum subsp. globosum]